MMYIIKSLCRKLKGRIKNSTYFSQSGQGATEFILMLVLVVGLIVGSAYQFNDAFKNFASNYFGEYLTCLLETGELPSLNSKGSGSKGVCQDEHAEFSLASGRPPSKSGNGGGSAGDSSEDGGGSGSGVGGGSGSGYSGSGSGTDGGGSKNSFLASNKRGRRGGGGSGKKSKGGSGDVSDSEVAISVKTKTSDGQSSSVEFINGEGYYIDDPESQKKDRAPIKTSIKSTGSKANDKNAQFIVKKRTFVKDHKLEVEEMGFGKFLRYFIIIIIILAIILFFGSQAMQISKSME